MDATHRSAALVSLATAIAVLAASAAPAIAQDPNAPSEQSFFTKSLHYTNRGIEFIYSKEQGGLERITGMTAAEAGCLKSKCHVRTCDTCHRKDADGKASYTLDPNVVQAACATCHDAGADSPDVHFGKGMKCMDCHSAREVHGDGVAYDTYMKPGVLDTRCEKCHATISPSASHTVHKGKLDCGACHVAKYTTCLNCHVDARLKAEKDVQIPLEGMIFLVNHGGKVKTANLLTCVYGRKSLITIAPMFVHAIVKEGRACGDCHATKIVEEIAADTFVPVRWENGEARNVKGVIPVVEKMTWRLPLLAREGGKWTPLKDAEPPLINYSGYCAPLTRDQLARLRRAQAPGR